MARIVVEVAGKDAGAISTLNKTNSAAAQLGTTAAKTAATLGGSLSKSTNAAGVTLSNFGRIASDAPFGIIGIQNNIGPLIESFQNLQKQTGSSAAAFKALGASLVGSGGLLIAVQLISAALTVLAQNPEKVEAAFNSLAGATDDATESLKAYNEELAQSQANALVEINTLNNLVSIASDENKSRKARTEALKELKKEYPEQLEFLTLENIKSVEAANAVNLLSDALIRQAKIQAAQKILGEAYVKQLEAQTKSTASQASTLAKFVGAALNVVGFRNFIVINEGLKNQSEQFKEAAKDVKTYSDLIKDLQSQEADAGTLFDDPIKKGKTRQELLKELDELRKELLIKYSEIRIDLLNQPIEKLKDDIGKITRNNFSSITDKPLIPLENIFGKDLPGYVSKKLDDTFYKIRDFSKQAGEVLSSGVANGIGDFASSIGNAIAAGDSALEAGGLAILSTVGTIATQLGKAAVSIGVGMIAIKKAFTNPLSAIAAGVALIAIGSFITGSVSKITQGENSVQNNARYQRPPGFAGGVTNFEGGLAYVHAGELLTNLPTGANVIPRAKTDRLLGSMGGGAGSWEVAGVLRGQDIEIAVRRTVSNNAKI